MKKKLLFVIPSLGAGGAEKSLVNLLNVIDAEKYEVDLFLFSATGLFMQQLPDFVRIVSKPKILITFQKPLAKSILKFLLSGNAKLALKRIKFALAQRKYPNSSVAEQYSWKYLATAIKPLDGDYDAAIGFLEKSSVYFVGDKVRAKKKIGFIHNDYTKLALDPEFDDVYFQKLSCLATVSEECLEELVRVFPQYRTKIYLTFNIVSPNIVTYLSQMFDPGLCSNAVVSIGRLHPQKGFDMAIEATKILKKNDVNFHWYIIGEGPEKQVLESLIKQYDVQDQVTLLGLRENPYPYIRQATVFVQCSRYEGKSIAIDEAKILAKPILLTDFSTAKDQINNEVDGIIVEMNAEAIATGVQRFLEDEKFRHEVAAQLADGNFGTEDEIEKFYSLI